MALTSALEHRQMCEDTADSGHDEDHSVAVLFELLQTERQAEVIPQVESAARPQVNSRDVGQSSLSGGEVVGVLSYLLARGARYALAKWGAAAAVALVFAITLVLVMDLGDGDRTEPVITQEPSNDSRLPSLVATLTAEHDAAWDRRPGQDLYAGQRLTLNKGLAEITTLRGAVLLIQAPATIELLHNDNAVRLQAGKLVGVCETRKSKGFVVRTPFMDIKDLGTRFGVDTTADAATRVHVFEGEVEAALPPQAGVPAERQHLTSGQALAAEAGSGFQETAFDPNRFVIDASLESLRPDFARTRACWLGQLSGDLEQDRREADALQVFIERRGLALREQVPVDFNADHAWDTQAAVGQYRVQAGEHVDVYLLHFDLIKGFESPQHLVIDFGRPILGVIVSQDTLDATDAALGADGVIYPRFPAVADLYGGGHRGLNYIPIGARGESASLEYTNDLASISPDGTQLMLRLWGGHGEPWSKMDQVRVLVRADRGDNSASAE